MKKIKNKEVKSERLSEMKIVNEISKIKSIYYDFSNCKVNYIDLLLNGNVYDYNLNDNDYCKRCNNKEKLCNVYLKRLRSSLLDWNEERQGLNIKVKKYNEELKVFSKEKEIRYLLKKIVKDYSKEKKMANLKLKSKINRSSEIKKSKYYNKMLSERLLKLNEEELNEIEKISIIENKIDRRKRKDNDLKERINKMSIEEFNEIKELFVEGN